MGSNPTLSVLYYSGQGLSEKDIVNAYAWLSLAADAPDEVDAAQLRDGIAEEMTAAQLAEAEALSQKYRKAHD